MNSLGLKVQDCVSGFVGIVTAEIRYLCGEDRVEITSQVKEGENEAPVSIWVEKARVQSLGSQLVKPNNSLEVPLPY